MAVSNIRGLLGVTPSSDALAQFIASFPSAADPEVKSYSDAVYFNYYTLGLSLLFTPQNGYKPATGLAALFSKGSTCTTYPNLLRPTRRRRALRRAKPSSHSLPFPGSHSVLAVADHATDKDGKALSRPREFTVDADTTGKYFVECFGEPARKGGGAGPSSGSIGIWCEWSRDGLMVEFGGEKAQGPQAWERGKDAIWKVISVFAEKDP
ncbi:hypothetical protein C8R46DRAFT_1089838 [Mycena filopes]|nr:hypothetical protein C8R46DRAFT_1089838 [Mycena filopes]